MNPLDDHPLARRRLYLVQWLVAGALTLIGIGIGTAGHELPQWYAVTLAVTGAAWSYLGLTASQNVNLHPDQPLARPVPPGDRGAVQLGVLTLAGLVVLAIVVLAVLR